MGRIYFKKALILIILALLSLSFVECSKSKISNPDGMTPIETVQRYFDYWQEKNIDGMNSLVYSKIKWTDPELEIYKSIKLNSCVEHTGEIEWYDDWYKNPYEYQCVDVSFEETYKKDGTEGFITDSCNWEFYLAKESNDTNWFIVMITSP